jgi:cytochrome P450
MAVNDVEIGGCPIKAGTPVAPMLGSANRDESRFPDASSFKPERPSSEHVSFGLGLHFCLGSPVARLTAQTAFTTISQRFPDLELIDEDIPWSEKVPFRTPLALHVKP